MPKYLGRRRVGYCQRTGKKVLYEDLIEDPRTGLLVEKGWDDPIHPQEYLPPPTTEVRSQPPTSVIEPEDTVVVGPLYDE